MSMTDEGTRPSNQTTARQTPEETQSGQNGAGHTGGGLPGLAAFGQMQGYTPVTGEPQPGDHSGHDQHQEHYEQSVESAPEQPAPEQDVSLEAESQDYAEQFVQDYTQDYSQGHEAEPQFYASDAEPEFEESGIEESAALTSEELHNYMAEQQASLGGAQHEPEASGYDPGPALPPDETADDGNTSLQTFEAHYDQHPEIPLGVFDEPGGAQEEQPFFDEQGQVADADFLGGEAAAEVAEPKERRGRKILMAASGLIGVLALGGALAFAYKIGGDSDIARTDKPPLIQADSSPVKVAPEEPGGKQFAHTNKKIYERLGGKDQTEETVKLKPREEDVAAAATAAVGNGAQAGSEADTGGPRKVKTLTVRPDGTIEAPADSKQKVVKAPPAPAANTTTASDGTVAMSFPSPSSETTSQDSAAQPSQPQPATGQTASAPPPVTPTIPQQTAPQQTASVPQQQAAATEAPSMAAPPPVQKPSVPQAAAPAHTPQQTASAPAAAPATGGNYVVQVAARKNQTDALAAFADIQQKYPRLLDGYRPIIKRADLGSKGVWYRLNVGPVESKQVASALCGQLKSAGMKSCLVRAQ